MKLKASIVLAALLFIGAGQQNADLPPVSWTCVMHPEVVEGEKGLCPLCKKAGMTMNLVPVRLDTVYSCPLHAVVQEKNPGKCPICRRDLIPLTMQLSFTCADHPEIDKLDPGKCPDGSPMEPKYSVRAHGNHNPQHNGQFFMAEDSWHHIEGAYPEEGVFRFYLYDDYTKPLSLDLAKQVTGRVVTKAEFDNATSTEKEIRVFPLKLAPNGQYLEAKVDTGQPPVQMTAKVKFKSDQAKESRFDFNFPELSQDKGPMATFAALGIDPVQSIDIPDSPGQILKLLKEKADQVEGFVQSRDYGQIWVPAFQAKDLVLALDVRTRELPASRRASATASVDRVVKSAWLLDTYGDTGDRVQIEQAFATFAQAVGEVQSAYRQLTGAK